MILSFIIVNWNTREYLRRCLLSVRANPPAVDHEIIVIDNASPDRSADLVREEFPEVRLIANPENRGYAQGNNQGFEEADGEYMLLLNPDVEVSPGSVDALLACAKSHPDAAAVGCRLVGRDGCVQRSLRSFPEPWGVFCEYTKLSKLFPRSRWLAGYRMSWFDYDREIEVDQPMGSCLLIRRGAIEDIGMFANEFPVFFNEVDWLYRAREKGWKSYFTPAAEMVHVGGASTRQRKPAMVRESHRSMKLFYSRHYRGRIVAPAYWFVVAAISINSVLASCRASLMSKGGERGP
ncbi:MAG: glycosyltransferase family 2 protein [Armatimonadetes bacterium]|nr:glycosyltransferase family 2 protein [Armatimonadota bacterium]